MFGEIVGALTGIGGLFGANDQARKQNQLNQRSLDLQERGLRMNEEMARPQIDALRRLFEMATNYNPETEGKATAQMAKLMFEQNLQSAMNSLGGSMGSGGGSLSSEGAVRELSALQGASSPFAQAMLEANANPTMKKMSALGMVLGNAPSGGLSDAYFRAAGNMQNMAGMMSPDYSGAMGLLGGSLDKLFNQDEQKRKNSQMQSMGKGVQQVFGALR